MKIVGDVWDIAYDDIKICVVICVSDVYHIYVVPIVGSVW